MKVTGLPWSPNDNSKQKDLDTFVVTGRLAVEKEDKEVKDFGTGPEEETRESTEELEPASASTELPMATEEPSTPRFRAREEDLPLAESPLTCRRITKTWGSPKREAREAELVEVEKLGLSYIVFHAYFLILLLVFHMFVKSPLSAVMTFPSL